MFKKHRQGVEHSKNAKNYSFAIIFFNQINCVTIYLVYNESFMKTWY